MLSREYFKRLLTYILDELDAQDIFEKALQTYAPSDFTGFHNERIYNLLDLLADMAHDTDNWIEWWIYDTKRGRENNLVAMRPDINPPNYQKIRIKSMDDLYNILENEYRKELFTA